MCLTFTQHKSMARDVTPLLMHWNYVPFELCHQNTGNAIGLLHFTDQPWMFGQHFWMDGCTLLGTIKKSNNNHDSKVYGANMGPIWGRQDPGGPHIGPMNFSIWEVTHWSLGDVEVILQLYFFTNSFYKLISLALSVKLVIDECHRNSPVGSQHFFR